MHTMVHEQLVLLSWLSPRRASDGGVLRRRRALSAFYHDRSTSTIRTSGWSRRTAIAKMPTIAPWPTSIPSASPSCIQQHAQLLGQLPEDDVLGPGRGLCDEPVVEKGVDRILMLHADHEQMPRPRPCVWAAPPAPTVRLYRRRHRLALGPSHGAPTAVINMPTKSAARRTAPLPGPREGQGRTKPPDGLRPPRLQELRSARQRDAPDLP